VTYGVQCHTLSKTHSWLTQTQKQDNQGFQVISISTVHSLSICD